MKEIDTFKQLQIDDDMNAKKLVTTLLTIMDRDGNRELDASELETTLLRLYKFISTTVFGLQRYTSMWLCKILADEPFAEIIADFAQLTVKAKGNDAMKDATNRLSQGVTIAEAIEVYQLTKSDSE